MNDLQSVLGLKVGDIAYVPALGVSKICSSGLGYKVPNWILILTKGSMGMDFLRFETEADAIKMKSIALKPCTIEEVEKLK